MKTYFMGSWVNQYGINYMLRRHGKKMASPIGLYIDGVLVGEYGGKKKEKRAKVAGQNWEEIGIDES